MSACRAETVSRGRAAALLSAAAVLALLVFLPGTSSAPVGPGGPPPDPFDLDHSPRAEAFRQARKEAEEEGAKPRPDGMTSQEHRQQIADAYEHAVSLMPEATPAPDLLLSAGWTLGGGPPESEQPDKAIPVFERVIREYPQNHRCVIWALLGLGSNYETKKDWAKAAEASQRILDYNLPDDADKAAKDLLATYRKVAKTDYERRYAWLHGVNILYSEVVEPGATNKYVMKDTVGSADASPDESGPSTDAAAAAETQEKPEEGGRGSAAAPAVGPRLGWVVVAIVIAGAAVAVVVRLRRARNREGG